MQLHHNTLREDPHRYPMVGELYTETEPVSACAIRKGHAIMQSITLKTGYDLLKVSDRRRANMDIRNNRPFCLMIAFPCSVWSNLINMTTRGDPVKIVRLAKRRKYEKIFVEYAAMKAVEQGTTSSWRTRRLQRPGDWLASFASWLRMRRTWTYTTSESTNVLSGCEVLEEDFTTSRPPSSRLRRRLQRLWMGLGVTDDIIMKQ